MSRAARNRKNNKRNNHIKNDIPKITITAKITKIINQGRDTDKYNESLKEQRTDNKLSTQLWQI